MTFKNVAIIGANGFIGTHLAKKSLAVPGINVHLFGKNEHSVLGKDVSYRQIDIENKAQLRAYLSNIDIVYYLASGSIPYSTWQNPQIEVEMNLIPFLGFMETVAELQIKKVVFTSSAGTIYGTTTQKANEDYPKNPFSPHGIVKLTMEYFLNYFKIRNGISFDVYRISNCYGPGQNTSKGLGLINTFLERIIQGREINIFGNGETIRNYIFAEDLAQMMLHSLYDVTEGIYNASSNDHLSINEIIGIIRGVIKKEFDVVYNPGRQSDNPAIYLDNSRIMNENPDFRFTDIDKGIDTTYQHLLQIMQ